MNRRKSRKILERIVVEGELVLLTPTALGNGDNDGLTDISLLLDECEGKALLTGTSIAGALRNCLREREKGFKEAEDESSICRKLFGYHEENAAQSCLIIDDALSSMKPRTELRDGVRIDGKTRTAKDQAKFDLELLEAGTTFKLRFELLITQNQGKAGLVSAFVTALQGFENSEIFLGARKRRGYGECKIEKWKAKRFILTDKIGLIEWLKNDFSNPVEKPNIAEVFEAIYKDENLSLNSFDQREYFEIKACFELDGSILIRSGSKLSNISEKAQPDAVHLRSNHKGKNNVPVVSGTSLAGVLRHRAVKICNTISTKGKGEEFVERIFGVDMEELKRRNTENKHHNKPLEESFASRLEVKETPIENTNDLVQTRIKIDRFTGGAFEGALFDTAPVFAKSKEKAIDVSLKLRSVRLTKKNGTVETDEEKKDRTDAEIGLLLLLLKDLWTGDLPIGGESSIGRGRLKGISAKLWKRKDGLDEWKIKFDQTLNVTESDRSKLNGYVKTLNDELK